MRSKLILLALIAETGLIILTSYVFYRWRLVHVWPGTPVDPTPYGGAFEAIVAPWLFASMFIPACFIVLTIARRFIRP